MKPSPSPIEEPDRGHRRPLLAVYVGLPRPRQFVILSKLCRPDRPPRVSKVDRGIRWMLPATGDVEDNPGGLSGKGY
jgi:hypothetical protein